MRLPAGGESEQVARVLNPSGVAEPLPLAVVWVPRQEGERITPGQEAAAREVTARLAGPSLVPVLAEDGRALIVVVPEGLADLRDRVASVREAAASVSGTTVHLAGPAAAQVDLDDAFAKIDGTLLAVALGGVLVILLLVYRSVLMPLLVIAGALLALAAACAALYALARWGLLPIDGQTQGIVFVLVVGASTDYALLLAARHREELAGQPDAAAAMAAACRATAPPVLASAGIIACAMMTLTLSDLPAERALGPAVAIAMVCCAAVSLTFLPALLVLCGPRTLRLPYRAGNREPLDGHCSYAYASPPPRMGGQPSAAGRGSGLRTTPRVERRSPAPGPAGRCALRGRARGPHPPLSSRNSEPSDHCGPCFRGLRRTQPGCGDSRRGVLRHCPVRSGGQGAGPGNAERHTGQRPRP